ncbi:hypothetical protein CEUSTIGMA_g230.t1 [Chlamydomonas eustigma]|uniref:UspA domain-containing protein n=1 Tax=Chlamydomonas eustigma TaxID=1157962 RepID=A0A250WPK0_9CHLO|nr:hypothetical protein CEUSTIGMA_g230.t1 [Chlamydomonas eustigma]|eukprot:GAX72774.1 hypothetical protein CEUSTIGMA_g230.t1 [Chlamydomonas eustigma]
MTGFIDLHDALSELKKRYVGGTHLAVAVDGSTISDKAAAVAARFVDTKRKDMLTVLHVSDKTKLDRLPKNLLPQNLKSHYKDMMETARIPMEWICREKEEGQSTCQTLTKIAAKQKVNLLVLGSFGRKGEKLEMLGTVSDYSLRESPASICIVRSTGAKFDKMAKILFCTDGSHAAALAFCTLIKCLKGPMDIVNVVIVSTGASDGVKERALMQHYHEFMVLHKVVGETLIKNIDTSKTAVHEGILEAASDMFADVLVLGISGYGQKKLGSVSERISANASCTTLIIKDSFEIASHRYGMSGSMSMARDILPSGRQY